MARFPNVLVVHPSLGVNSIAQLIDRAKAMPGKLDYATAGTGATSHLATALFMAMVGIEMNHVPYKGTSQSIQDVVAGRVPVTLDNLGPILPFIRSGQLIALGVSTRTPLSLLPNVPPIASVAPGYEASSWNALTAPAATPTAIIAKLSGEANRILRRPEVIEQLRTFGSEAAGGTPEETAQFLLAERVRWKRAVDAAKVKP